MAKNLIDVDEDDFTNLLGIVINEFNDNFSDEWISCDFMNKVQKELANLRKSWSNAAVPCQRKNLERLRIISQAKEPELHEFLLPTDGMGEFVHEFNKDENKGR